jgi:hypothetical protein
MDIGTGGTTDEIVEKIKSHIREKFNKTAIYDALAEPNLDNAVVYLNEYLFARETGAILNLDTSKIEIEQIMPSSGRNLSTIREDAAMSEDEFNLYANKLGNKILLEQQINSAIGRDWFITKKQKSIYVKRGYKDSAFPIANSLTSYPKDKWEKADIDKATEKAAQRITEYIFN